MATYSHAQEGYECPFCQVAAGVDRPGRGTKQRDIVYRNDYVTAFIATKWWPNNKGHAIPEYVTTFPRGLPRWKNPFISNQAVAA